VSASPSLLESVAGLLRRTYRIDCGLGDLAAFVIGDEGFRRIYAGERLHRIVGAAGGPGAQLLIRQHGPQVRARIYYPDALIRTLEQNPPQRGLHESNVEPFSDFVEEIDHLLLLARRTRQGRAVSLFEMELQANVSKYLVLSRFLAGRRPSLPPARRVWLRDRLFGSGSPHGRGGQLSLRYRDAVRWSVKFLDGLSEMAAPERVLALRRFHEAGTDGKLRLAER
jgi:hypothetical protein